MVLGSTKPLTEMSTRNIPWGKGGRCVGLTPCHLHVPIVLKSGSLKLLEPSGPVKACNGIALPYKNNSIFINLDFSVNIVPSLVGHSRNLIPITGRVMKFPLLEKVQTDFGMAPIFMTCHIYYLTSFSMPKVISKSFYLYEHDNTVFIGHINAYFDYILLLGYIFSII